MKPELHHHSISPQSVNGSSPSWSISEELAEIIREAGPEVADEVLRTFKEDTPSRLQALRTAILGVDPSRIKSLAHSLKGGAAQVGATRMADLCRRMEQLASSASIPDQTLLLEEIEHHFTAVPRHLSESNVSVALRDQKGPQAS